MKVESGGGVISGRPRYSVKGQVTADGRPYVELSASESVQLSPNEARRYALEVLRAAEAAVVDSMLVKALHRVQVADEDVAALLADLRRVRGE